MITSPPTDYIRSELASYVPNVEAGEDVRIVPVPEDGAWSVDVPQEDFWLIDSSELWSQCYDRDGTWLGAEHVTDPERVVRACYARDVALHHSLPWADYLREYHPEIRSYLTFTAGQS